MGWSSLPWLVVEGLLYLAERLPSAWAPAVALGAIAMVVPGIIHAANYCTRGMPQREYREALVYVHDHRSEQDAVWNWCPDLNTVYAGHVFCWTENPYAGNPHDVLQAAQLALLHPLWVIAPDNRVGKMTQFLQAMPLRQAVYRQFLGVRVLRFDAEN